MRFEILTTGRVVSYLRAENRMRSVHSSNDHIRAKLDALQTLVFGSLAIGLCGVGG